MRDFIFKDIKLPDPDTKMTASEVMNLYSSNYPELASGLVVTIVEGYSYRFEVKENGLS